MNIILLYLLIICGFAFTTSENTADTTSSTVLTTTEDTTSPSITTTEEPSLDATNLPDNATSDDMPVALALRLRREPPITIYKHRIRVSRRRRRPKPRHYKPRPVYGPPKYNPAPPIEFYQPPHTTVDEPSGGYSYPPPSGHDDKDSVHSVYDVSSDFNIQSIPAADYGGSTESFEVGYGPSDEGPEIVPFEPGSYHYPKPAPRKKPKKHHSHEQIFDGPPGPKGSDAPYSYSPPAKQPSSYAPDHLGPSFSYEPPGGHDELPNFSYDTPTIDTGSVGPSYSYEPPKKSKGSSSSGYSYEPPKSTAGPSYNYEPPKKSHGSFDSGHSFEIPSNPGPSHSYSPPTKLPESNIGDYKYEPPSNQGGYSYPTPKKNESKQKPKGGGYSYPTPTIPFTPHENYGVPPALQPPSSSYGYPILPHPTQTIDHVGPSGTSAPGSLYDLPSFNTGSYKTESQKTPASSEYNPFDSTHSFTTNSNSYNSLPTVGTKAVGGPFAEPPPNYKTDAGLSTSQFPLDYDHLSSTYGSPKSSYEVPIYDAVPFVNPEHENYPPNPPLNYNHINFQTATGTNKVEVSVPRKNRNRKPGRKSQTSPRNTLPEINTSLEDYGEPSPDYLDEVIESQDKRKKKQTLKHTRGANRYLGDGGDTHGAFSSESVVRVRPNTSVPTISTVLSTTSKRAHPVTLVESSSNQFRKQDSLNTREDITEISLKSPEIYVGEVKTTASGVTRQGSVFDDTLNYWRTHSLPRNHKLQ